MTCPYCNGTGRIYIEPRSSVFYQCVDCLEPGEDQPQGIDPDQWADDQDYKDD